MLATVDLSNSIWVYVKITTYVLKYYGIYLLKYLEYTSGFYFLGNRLFGAGPLMF